MQVQVDKCRGPPAASHEEPQLSPSPQELLLAPKTVARLLPLFLLLREVGLAVQEQGSSRKGAAGTSRTQAEKRDLCRVCTGGSKEVLPPDPETAGSLRWISRVAMWQAGRRVYFCARAVLTDTSALSSSPEAGVHGVSRLVSLGSLSLECGRLSSPRVLMWPSFCACLCPNLLSL